MNFYIVFSKSTKRFEKYVKLNKIKNKIIVDIKQQIEEQIDYNKYKDYFNLMIFTKINHALRKGKDVYYIPNFTDPDIDIKNLFKIKEILIEFPIQFNALIFFDEFKLEERILKDIYDNIDNFNNSQIIESY